MTNFFAAMIGSFFGTFFPMMLVYFYIKKSEREVVNSKKKALEELVEARKVAMQKVQDNIHDAILTGKIKTMGSQSKLYPFDDDDDKGGSFN